MCWGFRPALPLTGGSDPGGYVRGLCPPISTMTRISRAIAINSNPVQGAIDQSVAYVTVDQR